MTLAGWGSIEWGASGWGSDSPLIVLSASGSVSSAFAASSSGVVTQVPGSGALLASFTASGSPVVRVSASGSLSASFVTNGSVGLPLAASSVSASFVASVPSMIVSVVAAGTISARFAGSSSAPQVTAYASGALTASFATSFAPEGLGIPSNVSASFAASAAVSAFLGTAGIVVALFGATSVTADLAVYRYSTQPGNPWIVSVESYSFQLQHRIWGGVGLPTANLGTDGDYYFRKDGSPGARMYARASGAWSAIN